jgi:hypothetical protein
VESEIVMPTLIGHPRKSISIPEQGIAWLVQCPIPEKNCGYEAET